MSARIAKLTKRIIDATPPEPERYVVWDSMLKGFGLRVEPSGTKTFLIRYRIAGRKRFLAIGRFGHLTPEQARGLAQATLADVRHGTDPAEERREERAAITVNELAKRFLAEHVGPKRKSTTAVHYRSLIERYVLPKHGPWKAHDFTRSDLARIHLSMRDHPYQANRLLAVVASMYSFAERLGLVADGRNPAARIERFPETRRERFLTTEELARLGEAFRRFENDGRFREGIVALRLLLFTGARLREILHLRWEHVDMEWGLLFLPDSKTGKKTIFLNAPALAVLRSQERGGACVIPGADPNFPRADLEKPWVAVTDAALFRGCAFMTYDIRSPVSAPEQDLACRSSASCLAICRLPRLAAMRISTPIRSDAQLMRSVRQLPQRLIKVAAVMQVRSLDEQLVNGVVDVTSPPNNGHLSETDFASTFELQPGDLPGQPSFPSARCFVATLDGPCSVAQGIVHAPRVKAPLPSGKLAASRFFRQRA